MNPPKLIKVSDYLAEHRYDITAAICLAAEGDYEILRSIMPEKEGWNLLGAARNYGEQTKIHLPSDFPIALSADGFLTKNVYRLAGLILSHQPEFLAVPTSLFGIPPEKFKFSKEDKEKIEGFYDSLVEKPVKSSPPKPATVSSPPTSETDQSESSKTP